MKKSQLNKKRCVCALVTYTLSIPSMVQEASQSLDRLFAWGDQQLAEAQVRGTSKQLLAGFTSEATKALSCVAGGLQRLILDLHCGAALTNSICVA